MINLRGDKVILRAVEPRDIDLMYGVENDLRNWDISNTTAPFSKYLLEKFIDSQANDIFTTRQLRLMVETLDSEVVGMVDIYNFDPYNHRAGVGILIFDNQRKSGYASDALNALHRYCSDILQLHQLWCDVGTDNPASVALFKKNGYIMVGRKRDWHFRDGKYHDEILLQKVLEV